MSRLTVVIADDSEIMRASIRQLLEHDFEIIGEAEDGGAAIEVAKQLAPDVIVMDIAMPVINGIEAARRLREGGCTSGIVFLSVHRQRDIVRQAMLAANCGYVAKSDARRELADAVRAVVGGTSFLSRSLDH